MSNDDDLVSITDVLGDEIDYHAMMNAEPGELSTVIKPDVTTVDGGGVILDVSRTFYESPVRPKWSISIIAEDVDQEDPDIAGHMCRCGEGPHEKGDGPCREIITLGSDAAVRLAHEIIRLAEPLSDGAQHD
jgi:hypothetical protein